MALLKRKDIVHSIYIESYGVVIKLCSNAPEALVATLPEIKANLPGCKVSRNRSDYDHEFAYVWNSRRIDGVYKNGEAIDARRRREWAVQLLGSQIRLTVAEFAPNHIFLHAGVVAVNGKAIVIPAKSFKGKTTLTAELVKAGAVYYSDEYAIIDEEGNILPFPKDLSMRGIIDAQTQIEIPVENIGGTVGIEPIKAGLIIITEFSEKARWRPEKITAGNGFLELISNTVSIRQNPQFVIAALGNMIKDAEIIKSRRGDAELTAKAIMKSVQTS